MDGTNIGNDYAYNANGALTKDQNKGITKIEYDLLGNPKKVTLTDSRSIEYVYSADGRRLRAVHKSKISSEKTDYVGGLILKNGKPQMYRFSGGYYDFKDDGSLSDAHYYIADYQGNNRMVVNASTDAVEQVSHYYAYGGIIGNLSSNEGLQEFKFGDKKLDRTYGLDLYDFEARQYDAITPWFTSIDPLAEKYYSISPYAYCAGDPVNLIDPTGCEFDSTNQTIPIVEQFEKDTESLINKNNKKIDKLKTKKLSGFLGWFRVRRILRLMNDQTQLNDALYEIGVLRNSTQRYSIVVNPRLETKYSRTGYFQYVEKAFLGVCFIPSLNNILIAHELKHAYQFETGAYSQNFEEEKDESIYDISDEDEAYARGGAYGGSSSRQMSYRLPKGPRNINTVCGANPTSDDIQEWVNKTRSCVRYGNKTYRYKK